MAKYIVHGAVVLYVDRVIEAECADEAKEIFNQDGDTFDINDYEFSFVEEATALDVEVVFDN